MQCCGSCLNAISRRRAWVACQLDTAQPTKALPTPASASERASSTATMGKCGKGACTHSLDDGAWAAWSWLPPGGLGGAGMDEHGPAHANGRRPSRPSSHAAPPGGPCPLCRLALLDARSRPPCRYGELRPPPHQVAHAVPSLRPPGLPHPEEHLRLLRLPRCQDPEV